MEEFIPFLFIVWFYIFYSLRRFPLPAFATRNMYEKERETLDAFLRGIGMFIGIMGYNTYFSDLWDGVFQENWIISLSFHLGLFFLLKIILDIVVWKIGSLWKVHLFIYLLWSGLFFLIVFLPTMWIDPESIFAKVMLTLIMIVMVWWLYARYFHRPWKFSREVKNAN